MSSYREVRKDLSEKMGDGPADRPCMICQRPTPWATLSSYGARCGGCYAMFCREGPVIRQATNAMPRTGQP